MHDNLQLKSYLNFWTDRSGQTVDHFCKFEPLVETISVTYIRP